MRTFACPHCRSLVFFENSVCVTCSTPLGFDRCTAELVELEPDGTGALRYTDAAGNVLAPCANLDRVACNWLAPVGVAEGLCSCCALTRTRPDDQDAAGQAAWLVTETAKRRLVFQLDALDLPTTSRTADPDGGLAFDLLSSEHEPVITGHDHGLITIDLAEGDSSHREQMRVDLAEPYRTMLGHLRHETGHWYWEVLIDKPGENLRAFRDLFGDETRDYAEALKEHYGKPDTGDWVADYVSHYAASHPWEDWAESFAHYLHIRDTIETCASWGLEVAGPTAPVKAVAPLAAEPADTATVSFRSLIDTWLPLTYALNAVNRGMGQNDLYPFILTPKVLDKLRFVHDAVRGS